MIIQKENLWDSKSSASYTSYRLDKSTDVNFKKAHPAMVICGGGGFIRNAEKEREPVALYYLNKGFQCFVLNYTLSSDNEGVYPKPVYELARMIALIRERADEWHIDKDQICLLGFSAGATVCASLSSQWHLPELSNYLGVTSEKLKPNAVILSYPLLDFNYQKNMIDNDVNKDMIIPLVGQKNQYS